MTQLPIALEYRARRSLLWAGGQPQAKELQDELKGATSELKSLKELALLRASALEQIESLPWKLGVAVVVALAAQGILLGFILRRR